MYCTFSFGRTFSFYLFPLRQISPMPWGISTRRPIPSADPSCLDQPLLLPLSLLHDWQIDRHAVLSLPFTSQTSLHPSCLFRVQCRRSVLRQGECSPELTISPRQPECHRAFFVLCQRGVNTHVWAQWIALLCLRHTPHPGSPSTSQRAPRQPLPSLLFLSQQCHPPRQPPPPPLFHPLHHLLNRKA